MPKGKRRMAPAEEREQDSETMQVDEGGVKDEETIDEEPKAKKKKAKRARQRSASGTQTFENGVLRALVLENFMNHANLRVEFDPHVNFIVGRNGARAPGSSSLRG